MSHWEQGITSHHFLLPLKSVIVWKHPIKGGGSVTTNCVYPWKSVKLVPLCIIIFLHILLFYVLPWVPLYIYYSPYSFCRICSFPSDYNMINVLLKVIIVHMYLYMSYNLNIIRSPMDPWHISAHPVLLHISF